MADTSSPPTDQLAVTTLDDEVPKAQFSDRVPNRSIIARPDGGSGLVGRKAHVGGWVRTGRKADKDAFVDGHLKIPPAGTKQKIELRADKVLHIGLVDPAKYPLPKMRLTLEFLFFSY